MLGCRDHIHVTELVPHGARPVETTRGARGRAVHGHYQAEGYAQQTSLAGKSQSSDNEVVVVRVNLEPYRTGQTHAVLLRILGNSLLQLRFDVRPQQRVLILVKYQLYCRGFN